MKSVLKECGFVLGGGEDFNLYLQTIEDKFLYLNLDYKDVRFDNMKSLIPTDSDVEGKIFRLFSEKIGNFKKPLPKLILIKCDELLNTNAEFIYRGPAYYLFRTFEDVIKIEYEGEIEQVALPYKPVVFFDFSENVDLEIFPVGFGVWGGFAIDRKWLWDSHRRIISSFRVIRIHFSLCS